MSDMAWGDWRRKAAGHSGAGLVTDALKLGLRFILNHPLAVAGGLLACLTGLLLFVMPVSAPAGAVPAAAIIAPPVAPPPAWIEIIKPIELFSLEAADLAKVAKVYRAKRHVVGGGREDILALGTLAGGEPALRLSVYRRGHETYGRAPIFADLAKLAGEAGLSIARSGLPDLLPTRFGRFEITDVALRAGLPATTPCSGFRLVLATPAMTMTGLACGGAKQGLSRERLACLLDRLDLASAGEDRQLMEFFAASDLRRNGACDGMRLAPDLAHAAWLDDRPATPKKNLRRH